MTPPRLDRVLVDRGLAATRAAARRAIVDGGVTVDGVTELRPARRTPVDADVSVSRDARRVGRGGIKLAHALERFGLSVAGARALDAGASTGGFTEQLLAAGASSVTAVDVGHGQLAERLQRDARVTSLEGVNVRYLRAGDLGPPFDVLVVDLSFISLTKVVEGLAPQVAPAGDVVLLVKPQFEAGPEHIARGGIVRTATGRRRALLTVADAWAGHGWHVQSGIISPIAGGDGNTEYFLWLRRQPQSGWRQDVTRLAEEEAS